MILAKYNIELHRIQENDIELIRKWRNDDNVSKHMFFHDYISKEMQKKWFAKINTIHNHYFKIIYDNQAIGLIHISDIDLKKRDAFSGMFIVNNEFRATDIPARASLCLLDYFFENNILYTIYAKTKKSNLDAIRYNASLGFEIAGDIEEHEGHLLRLTRENYLQKCLLIRTFFGKSPLNISLNDLDKVDKEWKRVMKKLKD